MLRHGEERLSSDTLEAHGCHERRADRDSDIKDAEQFRASTGVVNGNQYGSLGVKRARLNRLGDGVASLLTIVDDHVAIAILIGFPSVDDGRHIQPRRDILDELLPLVCAPLFRAANGLIDGHFVHRRRNGRGSAHAELIVLHFDFHFCTPFLPLINAAGA